RRANLKDSGSIMPGHGGALDRLDSIVLAFPVLYYFVQ
ncbi:MAG: phosphatidate cytidylyltransferase, partial [SAR202 cluster bacterium]|nr:phosphatidate cytidylyltransferase [SAR202 cluster bacterium]